MPVVKSYVQQQTPQAAPNVRRTPVSTPQIDTPQINARPTPESLGAGLGEAVAQVGQGIFNDQLKQQRAEQEKAKLRADQVAIMGADLQTSQWITKRLFDPDHGAYSVTGKDAGALPETVMDEFKTATGDIRSSLSSQEQKDGYDRFLVTRQQNLYGDVMKHTSSELAKYDDAQTQAYVSTARGDAVLNSGDAARVDLEIDRQVFAITAHAKAYGGLGSEPFKAAIAEAKSNTQVEVIRRILAQGNDLEAKKRFDDVKDQISGKDIAQVESWMKIGSTKGESQRLALKIINNWQTGEDVAKQEGDFGVTVTAQREKTLTEALDEADKIPDPELQDATKDRIKQSYSAFKQTQNDLQQNEAARVKGIIDQQKAEEERKKAELDQRGIDAGNRFVKGVFDSVPPDVEANMPIAMRNQIEAYAKRNLKDEEAKTDPSTYYDLMKMAAADPDAFRKEILFPKYANKLSKGKLDQLIGIQSSIIKGDREAAAKELDGIQTNDRIINGALRKSGIDPEDKANKPRIDGLWSKVDEQIQVLQRSTGKKASNDEIQKITDELLIQDTIEKGSWWGLNPFGSTPFFDVKKSRFEADKPKVGDTKTFPNGKKGTWDGVGWAQQ